MVGRAAQEFLEVAFQMLILREAARHPLESCTQSNVFSEGRMVRRCFVRCKAGKHLIILEKTPKRKVLCTIMLQLDNSSTEEDWQTMTSLASKRR